MIEIENPLKEAVLKPENVKMPALTRPLDLTQAILAIGERVRARYSPAYIDGDTHQEFSQLPDLLQKQVRHGKVVVFKASGQYGGIIDQVPPRR